MIDHLARKFGAPPSGSRSLWAAAFALLTTLGPAALGDQSLTMSWNPSSDASVTGFNLYYSTNGVNYEAAIDVGTNTTYSVSGLTEGQTVYFYLTAYNAAGAESPPSSQLVYFVPGVVQLAAKTGLRSAAIINFPVSPGHTYSLQASINLMTWSTISHVTPASNCWMQVEDIEGANLKQRFYRLVYQ
jgi:hypothetical protein